MSKRDDRRAALRAKRGEPGRRRLDAQAAVPATIWAALPVADASRTDAPTRTAKKGRRG